MSATGKVTPETLPLRGGRPCLDFANTVDWTAAGEPLGGDTEALATPSELARWGRRLGLVGRCSADADELAAMHSLRLAVYRVFAAIAEERLPRAADLEQVRAAHAEAVAAGRPARHDGGWGYAWPRGRVASIRHAVAADAAALLADPGRVRRCPGRDCHWLFLDASGRRRWCSMTSCGSRAKMRTLYRRRRQASLPDGSHSST